MYLRRISFIGGSFIAHLGGIFFLGGLLSLETQPIVATKRSFLRFVAEKREAPPEILQPKEEAPPPPPKVSRKKIARKKKPTPEKEVGPVFGLSAASLSAEGHFVAPLGNDLLSEDKGVIKDKVEPREARDLSAAAKRMSLREPEYTPEAIDAMVSGRFVVEVYIDEAGVVKEAELAKRIGYGMDARVLESAFSARFIPRKNSIGESIGGWDQIVFQLILP